MSTACDLLLLSTCGLKDHNSPSCSSDQSTSACPPVATATTNNSEEAATRRCEKSSRPLLKSLKQLLRGPRRQPQPVQPQMTTAAIAQPSPSPPLLPDRHLSLSAPKPQVYVVGSPNPKSPFLRIAHVSDTCGLQDSGYSIIYEADVIVHSGNLCPNHVRKPFFRDTEFVSQLKAINEFFAALPHRYKIFVPGPNEAFAEAEDRERVQALLPNCVYLHDSGCVIEGVRFHGVGCAGRRFGSRSTAETKTAWSNVPDNVDVLVSHAVPTNSLYDDLVTRLRPKMLLYGSRLQRSSRSDQPTEENCVKFKDNVIFSNGHAGNAACKRGIFDFYADDQAPRETHLPQVSPAAVSDAYRSLPMPNSSGGFNSGGGGGSRYGGLLRCILS